MITGGSGCGKSTLLNIIGGLDNCDEGLVQIDGNYINAMTESEIAAYRQNTIGFIFQFHYLLKDFTCLENVMMPLYMAGESRKRAMKKAEELLCDVKLEERLNHYPSQLSGGERQRAAMARALINDPELILADEPTGNLDEENSLIVEELLFRLVAEYGKTLIMVTHDLDLAGRGSTEYRLTLGELVRL